MSTNTTVNEPGLAFTPLYAPNVFFFVVFILFLIGHFISSIIFWRRYGYTIGILLGVLLEVLGYDAKVQLSHNRHNKNAYIMYYHTSIERLVGDSTNDHRYIIGLTLGPTFLSASLYVGIGSLQRKLQVRIIRGIGPRGFAGGFILADFTCLCFIGCGGSLAAIYANNPIGVDLIIAGLALQVLWTAIFCVLLGSLYWRHHAAIRYTREVHYIRIAACGALCLFIRSCWRVAELSCGFNGPITQIEGLFIALDSVPMLTLVALLTAMHPAIWFPTRKMNMNIDEELCTRNNWASKLSPLMGVR